MALIAVTRPILSQPQGAFAVNRGHPISRGLVLLQSGVSFAAGGGTLIGGSAEDTAFGRGFRGGPGRYCTAPANVITSDFQPFTVAFELVCRTAPSGMVGAFSFADEPTSTSPRLLLQCTGSEAFRVYFGGDYRISAGAPLTAGKRVKVVFTHDGSVGRLYLDGAQAGSYAGSINLNGSPSWYLGAGYNGLLDAVYIWHAQWSRVLSPTEVALLSLSPWLLVAPRSQEIDSSPSSGGASGDAPGATIAFSSSVVSGTATGAATSPGRVVSAAANLVPGAATGAADAPGATLSASASLAPGAATGAAAAPGQTLTASTTLIVGAATAGGVGDAPGATLQAAVSLLPGAATGAAAAGGQMLTRAESLVAGSATGAAVASGQTLSLAASLLMGAATGAAAAGGQAIVVSSVFIPGLASAAGVGNAPGATLQAAVSLLPGNTTGAAAVGGQTLTRAESLLAGGATGAAAAGGQALSLAASLLPGAATGAAAAAGQAIVVSNVFTPGLASAGGVGNAPGATLQAASSLLPGVATGGATVVGALLQAVFALLPGTATGGGVPGDDVVAPGAELLAYLYLLAGEASGVVVDDYPMKYATLADMVTRYGQTELAQLTDAVNVPPSTIDTTRVQIAINDAQMEIDSAVGRIYRLPLAGCIRPPVPPGTEPTAVAPPQLTRLACDIARFFLYDDLAPENEVVRRYKQAKNTLEDIASGALQLACPWGGSPGELIGTDAQSGSAEVYDCFSPRQITDDTLRGF